MELQWARAALTSRTAGRDASPGPEVLKGWEQHVTVASARDGSTRPAWQAHKDAASSVRCRAAGNHLVTTASAAMGLNEPGRIKTRDAGPEVHPTPERRRFSAPVVVNTDAVVNDYLEQRPQTLLLTDRLLLN